MATHQTRSRYANLPKPCTAPTVLSRAIVDWCDISGAPASQLRGESGSEWFISATTALQTKHGTSHTRNKTAYRG